MTERNPRLRKCSRCGVAFDPTTDKVCSATNFSLWCVSPDCIDPNCPYAIIPHYSHDPGGAIYALMVDSYDPT